MGKDSVIIHRISDKHKYNTQWKKKHFLLSTNLIGLDS